MISNISFCYQQFMHWQWEPAPAKTWHKRPNSFLNVKDCQEIDIFNRNCKIWMYFSKSDLTKLQRRTGEFMFCTFFGFKPIDNISAVIQGKQWFKVSPLSLHMSPVGAHLENSPGFSHCTLSGAATCSPPWGCLQRHGLHLVCLPVVFVTEAQVPGAPQSPFTVDTCDWLASWRALKTSTSNNATHLSEVQSWVQQSKHGKSLTGLGFNSFLCLPL